MSINKKVFSKAASADTFEPTKNFNTVLYTGTGAIQKVGSYINQGGVFNGSNSKIDVGQIRHLLGDVSVSVWLKTTSTASGGAGIIELNNNTSSDGWAGSLAVIYTASTGSVLVRVGNASNSETSVLTHTVSNLNNGNWHNLVVTRNDTTNVTTLYIDGSQVDQETVSATPTAGAGTRIGARHYSAGATFNGTLDQIRIFSKELSSSEVTTLNGETFDSATKSTTDIFSDRSGVALYQLDGNANDTGGAGYINDGAIFDGSTSYVEFAANTFQLQTVSISAWIKVDSDMSADGVIFSNYDFISVSKGLILKVLASSNTIRFEGYAADASGQRFSVDTSTTIARDTWVNVIAVADSSANNAKVYINGSEASYSTNTYGTDVLFHSGAESYIGALFYSGGSEQFFRGTIDEVRIYNDVLTTTEIGHIANNTTASIPTGNLEAYYKFDGTFQDDQQEYDGVGSNVTFRYDGTGSNVNFQGATRFTPDFVWIKDRGVNGANHTLTDSVRGTGRFLISNTTDDEFVSSGGTLSAFNSNGFTLAAASPAYDFNINGNSYAAWCWKGGGAAVTNNNGSVSSSVSANTAAGFSVVKFTAPSSEQNFTIGHGLTAKPDMVILKSIATNATNWFVFHKGLSAEQNYVYLNQNTQESGLTQDSRIWGQQAFTSSVISTRSNYTVSNSDSVIAYCFHDVTGYQKFGTYTGNGSASGNIVETGFEVAWIMIKRRDGGNSSWAIHDNKRSTSNPRNLELFANLSDAESTFTAVDFLDNGFELATSNALYNNNGNTYLYWAIAADPSTASTPVVTNAFDVVSYEGNSGTQSILTDTNPDFIWIKNLDTAVSHSLFDTIRGAGTANQLYSDATDAQGSSSTITNLVSFDTKGFTLGATSGFNVLNNNGDTHIAYLWSAGSHEGNLPTINTQGTLDSTVSVNDAAGFSIVKFTSNGAASVVSAGHGLSAEPELVIFKNMNNTSHWLVYVSSVGDNGYLKLDSTDAVVSFTPFFDITSTTIGVRQSSLASSGEECIAYCFKSISGYSAIGSYNGTSSSQSITLGFKPSFLLVKETNNATASSWRITDRVRGTNNLIFPDQANTQDTGGTYARLDSNGFTQQGLDSNVSGQNYIYYAVR